MSKHTPGPWTYQEESDAYTHIVRGPNNYFITQLSQDTSGRSEADARLIAAAPELLEACKAIAELLPQPLTATRIGEILAPVIKKAEGAE